MMPRVESSIRDTIDTLVRNVSRRVLDKGATLNEVERYSAVDDAAALIVQAVNQGETEEARLRRRDITTC